MVVTHNAIFTILAGERWPKFRSYLLLEREAAMDNEVEDEEATEDEAVYSKRYGMQR